MIKPLRILILGDSVLWGQGLLDEWKMPTIVKQWLGQSLNRDDIELQYLAHSGAHIGNINDAGPDLPGEIPADYPSITFQATKVADPGGIDIVLLNGGINDFGPFNIVNPDISITDMNWYREQAQMYCGDRMNELLAMLLSDQYFKNAAIVVAGYFPIISNHTSVANLAALLTHCKYRTTLTDPVTWTLREILTPRSNAWYAGSNASLQWAVNQHDPNRVALAPVSFGPQNCFGAEQSFLWGVGEDPLVEARRQLCEEAGRGCDVECLLAGTCHPNQQGAIAYAEAVKQALFPWLDRWIPEPRIHLVSVPERIVAGKEVSVRIEAKNRITGEQVAGMALIDQNPWEYETNADFAYTCHDVHHRVRILASDDYRETGTAFDVSLGELAVEISPLPGAIGAERADYTVSVRDKADGHPVPRATVTIINAGYRRPGGSPSDKFESQTDANGQVFLKQFAFHGGIGRINTPRTGDLGPVVINPTGTVTARDYEDASIDLGFPDADIPLPDLPEVPDLSEHPPSGPHLPPYKDSPNIPDSPRLHPDEG